MSDSDRPRVSVVLTTHNRARMLPSSAASALAQTVGAIELIIVDDGSTDDTPAVLHGLAGSDPRVRAVAQHNAGLASARNAGLDRARAPWVLFLDDDDLLLPRALEILLAAAPSAAVGAVAGRALRFSSQEPGLTPDRVLADADRFTVQAWPPGAPDGPATLAELLLRPLLQIQGAIFAAQRLRELGGFNPARRAVEDYELWLRLASLAPVPTVPEVVLLYRHQEGQMSSVLGRQSRETRLVLEAFLADHPSAWRLCGRSRLRRRLAHLGQEEAYAALLDGDRRAAVAAASRALAWWPATAKAWLYLVAALSPAGYRRIRTLVAAGREAGSQR